MLERYDADDRVFAITGTNYVPPQHQSDPSTYRFSRIPVVWGWATWRRAWQRYRFDIAGWRAGLPTRRAWHAMGGTLPSYLLWSANFDVMARHGIDTWDLQFVYACMSASGLTVVPPVNLVENVGFRPDATHTQRRPDHLRAVEPLVVPLREAPVRLDDRADRWMMRNFYGASAAGLARQGTRGVRRLLSGA
jgi:hypothetical protein